MTKKIACTILGMVLFYQLGFSQVGLKNKEQEELKHFSIASVVPFENECETIANPEKRTSCLEDALRVQILDIIGNETDYKGEMHLYFTVNKKGDPINIATRGFPSAPELEEKIRAAVYQLDLKTGSFRGRKANIRCYTRVFPAEIEDLTITSNKNDTAPKAIAFEDVKTPPLAPGCKAKWKAKKKKECTNTYIQKHIQKKFNIELASELGLTGRIKIMLDFIIDAQGNINQVTASGAPKLLTEHAKEVIRMLPTFIPASKDGIPISVTYKMPILFYVAE